MITRFSIIRNITQFETVEMPTSITFGKLTLIHAENGRGKTSISTVLRSLLSGDPLLIQERARLGTINTPHVVVQTDDANQTFVFQNNAWNNRYPKICIFDDVFISDNVYSGLEIQAAHRQNLHGIILGSRGVTLARQIEECTTIIAEQTKQINTLAGRLPATYRGQLTVDQFCDLTSIPSLEQDIQVIQKRIAASSQAQSIFTTQGFGELKLPIIDVENIREILNSTVGNIEQNALNQVTRHFSRIGEGAEQWISEGVNKVISEGNQSICPFCTQNVTGSVIINHYSSYFSKEYAQHKRRIDKTYDELISSLSGDAFANFQSAVQDVINKAKYWNQFIEILPINIDLNSIRVCWQRTRVLLAQLLERKRQTPLEPINIDDDVIINEYLQQRNQVNMLNSKLQLNNAAIDALKREVEVTDINQLQTQNAIFQATKHRYSQGLSEICETYINLRTDKSVNEDRKANLRTQLDEYRSSVFPRFEDTINTYLRRFGANFEFVNCRPSDAAGRQSTTYQLKINNTCVNLTAAAGTPSFKSTLSAGDRNSLALAFYFASLEQETNLNEKIIVLDDVVSSMDEHRLRVTTEIIRDLYSRVNQVVTLSHNREFLCELWECLKGEELKAMQIIRVINGSDIAEWDPTLDSLTKYDICYKLIKEYAARDTGNSREVAESIRFVLEGYLRVRNPDYMKPGTLLGAFIGRARELIGEPDEILNQVRLTELDALTNYANKFHHNTNPSYRTERINDGELKDYVRRTLTFIKA